MQLMAFVLLVGAVSVQPTLAGAEVGPTSIVGTVTASDTGAPLESATVGLYPLHRTDTTSALAVAMTDAAGSYVIEASDLDAGRYTMDVTTLVRPTLLGWFS